MSNDNQNQVPKKAVVSGTVKLTQSSFTWFLAQDSLTDIFKCTSGIKSPEFISNIDNISVRWQLRLKLSSYNKENIALFIQCRSHNKLKAKLDITVSNNYGNFIAKEKLNLEFALNIWLHVAVVRKQIFNQRTGTNNIEGAVTCTITSTSQQSKMLSKIDRYPAFRKIINIKKYSDIVLSVDGKELYAYKGILCSRSPVFMAMFSHNTTESSSNRVEISDISYDTMYHILRYMYTDFVPQFLCEQAQENYKKLLIAADKYDLENLKTKLAEDLVFYIQVSNVFEYLSFADLNNSKYLKEKAIDFIISNKDEIVNSESYKNFRNLHSDLSCEVFRCVLAKKRKLT